MSWTRASRRETYVRTMIRSRALPLAVALCVSAVNAAAPGGHAILWRDAAAAKPKRAKPPPRSTEATSPPKTVSDEPVRAPPAAAVDASSSTSELLAKAQALYAALDYEDVVAVTRALLARDDATIEMRLDAYLMQGSALAIVGDAVEAEKPFRFLLRGRPEFDMPAQTPPKILAVFRKVQVEERAIVLQMRELERARIVRELALEGETPTETPGGTPLTFRYRLRDPGRAVQSMNVHYRRTATEPFSSLALRIDDDGAWRAELPGEWTENEHGVTLEYYVTTADASGNALLNAGEHGAPLALQITPGTVSDSQRIYQSPWFWVAVGAAAAASGAGGYLFYRDRTKLPDSDAYIRIRD